MRKRVYNFGAGPATLPEPVMAQIQEEFLNYQGLGASVIEISHRSKEFTKIIEETSERFRRLTDLPQSYKLLYIAGGARMLFSSIPLNLMDRKPDAKAQYVVSGTFSGLAAKDAAKYGSVEILASGHEQEFRKLPEIDAAKIDSNASYLHITSNNTIYGTRWHKYPETGSTPLIIDATSDILGRVIDYSKYGAVYAGLQKNLGPSGMALMAIDEKLLGHARQETPLLLDFKVQADNNSLTNTTNTFAIYVVGLMLKWIEDEGGVATMEKRNAEKSKLLYDILDKSDYYKGYAHQDHRSHMNVTFNLPSPDAEGRFLEQAEKEGLYALKGHRNLGGIRASIYNAMTHEGVQSLTSFMEDFEARHA